MPDMNDLQSQNVLMMPVIYNGRDYLTSHRIHADYKAVGGEKYISVSEFNRMIRGIEAYPDYLVAENIVEISAKSQAIDLSRDADFASLLKSNSYNPVMLLDKAANVAVMNFLENEASRQFAVQGNNYLAEKLTAGPSLEDFMAKTHEMFRTSLVEPIREMCQSMKTGLQELRSEVRGDLNKVSGDIKEVRNEVTDLRQQTDKHENSIKMLSYQMTKQLSSRRRNFSGSDINSFVYVIANHYDGKCPCCQKNKILDKNNKLIIMASEKDHAHGRHLNKKEDGWIICIECHDNKTNYGNFSKKWIPAFDVFQIRLADMQGFQKPLPGL